MKFQKDYKNCIVMIQLPTGQEIVGKIQSIQDTIVLEHPFMVSLNTNNNNVLLMPFTLSMLRGSTVEINTSQIFSIAELSNENMIAYNEHVRSTVSGVTANPAKEREVTAEDDFGVDDELDAEVDSLVESQYSEEDPEPIPFSEES